MYDVQAPHPSISLGYIWRHGAGEGCEPVDVRGFDLHRFPVVKAMTRLPDVVLSFLSG